MRISSGSALFAKQRIDSIYEPSGWVLALNLLSVSSVARLGPQWTQ